MNWILANIFRSKFFLNLLLIKSYHQNSQAVLDATLINVLNLSCLSNQKCPDIVGVNLLYKVFFGKYFEEEIFVRTQPSTPLQIFNDFSLYAQVIAKIILVADDSFKGAF